MRDAFALLTTFGRRGGRLRAGALAWFPLVGVTLGAGLGCVWWASERLWPRLVAGALTVAADGIVLMLRVTALSSRAPSILLLAGIWCAARATVASVPRLVPYARETGIASPLLDGAR